MSNTTGWQWDSVRNRWELIDYEYGIFAKVEAPARGDPPRWTVWVHAMTDSLIDPRKSEYRTMFNGEAARRRAEETLRRWRDEVCDKVGAGS